MDKIEDCRNRLAALTTEGIGAPHASPADSLAACRARRVALRELKRDVLARLYSLRTATHAQAKKTLGPKPSPGELWERREEGARRLLEDVRQRVIGHVDDASAEAVEAWGEINREIDRRLGLLAELERKLAAAAGEAPAGAARNEKRDREAADDDLYAAVGAAVQQGLTGSAFCPHCGQSVEPDDRFCRRCGHHLG